MSAIRLGISRHRTNPSHQQQQQLIVSIIDKMTFRSALRAFKLLIFILARASSSLSPLALAALTARDPIFNRGLATPDADRQRRGIHGLLPKRIRTFERQEEAALAELRALPDPISQYKYLQSLQNVDERLYFALIAKHTAELMPPIYTPTVGEACVKWSSMLGGSLQPRGLYISLQDLGNVRTIVDNWPRDDVKVIVFTDGERILGLGDLGANGMGIPIGKLALYTACAGIDPSCCLPVVLDVGTNTDAVRDDPFYIGLPRERERGAAYDALVDEFVEAARGRFEGVLQFEDWEQQRFPPAGPLRRPLLLLQRRHPGHRRGGARGHPRQLPCRAWGGDDGAAGGPDVSLRGGGGSGRRHRQPAGERHRRRGRLLGRGGEVSHLADGQQRARDGGAAAGGRDPGAP